MWRSRGEARTGSEEVASNFFDQALPSAEYGNCSNTHAVKSGMFVFHHAPDYEVVDEVNGLFQAKFL